QNQERLDLAQTAGRIGTFDWFVPTGEVIWSQALESLYGLVSGGFGRTYEAWRQAVHAEDRSRVEAELQQAIAGRRDLNHEFRIVWPDGSIHWVRCVARVLSNEAGELQRLIGVNIDITEPKRVQQKLALSNERLGLIARATAAIVGAAPLPEEGRKLAEQVRTAFEVDACVIRILEGNDLVLLASAGIPEENLEPRLSADLGIPGEVMSSRRAVFVPDVPRHTANSSYVFRWPTGYQYVSYAGAPLLAQNRIVGILGIYSKGQLESFSAADLDHLQIIANHIAVAIVNDRLFKEVQNQKDQLAEQINERKRAEEALRESENRFRAISEQSLTGIYIIQEGRFSYVNPRFEEIFGYTRTELLALSSAVEVIAEGDRAQVRESIRRRLAGEIKGLRFRSHALRKDGGVVTIEAHGIQTELDGKAAILGTVQDVSEREQAESVLKRTTEQLQTLSRRLLELQEVERRHIARELHDEIGQALTALKINLQAVQRMADAVTFAPRLLDSISIVDRTLRQVRNLSLDLRPSMLDDLGLCAALRWYADQQAQRAGLLIKFVSSDLGGRLDPALETACFRVAQEALTNIVRHARASTVLVELKAEGAVLHLSVSDNGIGFDLDRLHPQTEHGSSLGLLGIEERASLLGGRIELRSAPQQGTEIHAWFPLAAAPVPSERETDLVEKR
ncbi:MAG: Multi-sensor signal transduction histidine kinase, partial [Pedosphaera sp.]|nr:Multi-sensor signal transduction histidine kinase [Pedosphaera sp.]